MVPTRAHAMKRKSKNERMATPVPYDSCCKILAQYFLHDWNMARDIDKPLNEKEVAELAGHIQMSIESWLSMNKKETHVSARAAITSKR